MKEKKKEKERKRERDFYTIFNLRYAKKRARKMWHKLIRRKMWKMLSQEI